MKFIELEQLFAERENVDIDQGAEKPEIGNTKHGQPKRPVGAQAAQAVENLAERVETKQLGRAGRRNARNPETGVITGDGDGDHQQTDQRQMVFPNAEDGAAQRRAQDDRHEGAHLQEPIAARQVFVGQHFGQDAVLGRTEKRRVQAHQKNRRQHHLNISRNKSAASENHDGDFKDFYRDEKGALAINIGEMAGVAGKQRGGQDEKKGDQLDVAVGIFRRQIDRHEGDDHF